MFFQESFKKTGCSSIHIIDMYMYYMQARYLELGEAADLDGLYEQSLHGQVVALDGLPHLAALLGGHGWEVTDLQGPAVVILRYMHAQAEHWGRKEIYQTVIMHSTKTLRKETDTLKITLPKH